MSVPELCAEEVLLSLQHFPVYLALIDVPGRIRWVNTVSYGNHHDEVLGKPASEHIAPEDQPVFAEVIRRAVAFGEVVSYEVAIVTPAPPGRARLRGRMAPVVMEGEVRYAACVVVDAGLPGPVLAPPANAQPMPGRWLSEQEEEILKVVPADGGWVTAGQVSQALGMCADLRVLMRNLANRGILESNPHYGFRRRLAGALAFLGALIEPLVGLLLAWT